MFVISTEYEHYGQGKIIATNKDTVSVEYFDSPVTDRIIIEVSKNAIRKTELTENTRIYYLDPNKNYWQVGRVLMDDGLNLRIQFPNKVSKVINSEEVFVRWHKPIEDPTSLLANFINETPYYATARSSFVRSVIEQRAASEGMSGLLSSVIELETHQISVVHRILQDPIQRYLLADEVGLGKTIEAGILIRQYVLDEPEEHKILVIVPRPLKHQWRQELSNRFLLSDYLDDSIVVICHDEVAKLREELLKAKMLVIDEVHHIAKQYVNDLKETILCDYIIKACHKAERLLLLSATPVIGNEKGFLFTLHLLDPSIYSLDDLSSFRKKIENRQVIADLIDKIAYGNPAFLADIIDELPNLFPEDAILTQLTEQLREILNTFPDEEDEDFVNKIRTIKSHVSETYRLHRRILRNKRNNIDGITPNRAGVNVIEYSSDKVKYMFELLEDWRNQAAHFIYGKENSEVAKFLKQIFNLFLESFLRDQTSFIDLVKIRLSNKKLHHSISNLLQIPLFEEEKDILEKMLEYSEQDIVRIQEITKKILQLSSQGKKTVIFCSSPKIADNLYGHLEKKLGSKVARHKEEELEETDDEGLLTVVPTSWQRFLVTENACNVLVCDHRAEEGLNLQGGKKCIIHFDLPFSPNRIEQRMGRVDRYGSGAEISTYTIICQDNPFECAWNECLSEGFGIFDKCIASLQYLIEEKMLHLKDRLLLEGVEAIQDFTQKLGGEKGEIYKELQHIRKDDFDALQDYQTTVTEKLEKLEENWKNFQEAIDNWTVKRLGFNKIPIRVSDPKPPDKVCRYEFSRSDKHQTLISINDFRDKFLLTVDQEFPKHNPIKPKTYAFSFRRQTAISKGVRLLRYGDTFLQALTSFTQQDDRGKSFAFWRYIPGYQTTQIAAIFFRFDFIIETNLDDAVVEAQQYLCSNKSALAILKRRADMIFSPIVETIWLNSELEPADTKILKDYLIEEYKRPLRNKAIKDFNLNSSRWEKVKAKNLDVLDYWSSLCFKAKEVAIKEIRKTTKLDNLTKKCIETNKEKDEYYYAQLRSRIAYLTGIEADKEKERLTIEQKINEALYQGVIEPKFYLDVIGAIFLSGTELDKNNTDIDEDDMLL